jgi:indole-3-glycerol phosphate synthase
MSTHGDEALEREVDGRRREVEARRRLEPGFRLRERLGRLRPAGRLERALRRDVPGAAVRLLCVVASSEAASRLADGGATALALATEPAPDTAFASVDAVRAATALPLLLDDLVVDEHQLLEAAVHGLDGVTLSVAAGSGVELQVRLTRARLLGLDALVRVTTTDEVRTALRAGATLLGLSAGAAPRPGSGVDAALELAPAVPALVTAVALAATALEPADLRRLAATRCGAVRVDAAALGPDPAAALAALALAARG